jgi:hypothetical protein
LGKPEYITVQIPAKNIHFSDVATEYCFHDPSESLHESFLPDLNALLQKYFENTKITLNL